MGETVVTCLLDSVLDLAKKTKRPTERPAQKNTLQKLPKFTMGALYQYKISINFVAKTSYIKHG